MHSGKPEISALDQATYIPCRQPGHGQEQFGFSGQMHTSFSRAWLAELRQEMDVIMHRYGDEVRSCVERWMAHQDELPSHGAAKHVSCNPFQTPQEGVFSRQIQPQPSLPPPPPPLLPHPALEQEVSSHASSIQHVENLETCRGAQHQHHSDQDESRDGQMDEQCKHRDQCAQQESAEQHELWKEDEEKQQAPHHQQEGQREEAIHEDGHQWQEGDEQPQEESLKKDKIHLLDALSDELPNSGQSKTALTTAIRPGDNFRRRLLKNSFTAHSTLTSNKSAQMSRAERIIHSRWYEMLNTLLVISNAACVGLQVQVVANEVTKSPHRGHEIDEPIVFAFLQIGFTVLFTADLILRWTGTGMYKFWQCPDDRGWNALDVVVVWFGWLDVVSFVFNLDSDDIGNLVVLRVMRIVRLVRIARIVRVLRFFRELRLMVHSILHSIKSLTWAVLILSIILYMFGLAFVSATTAYLSSESGPKPSDEPVVEYFGSIGAAMLTLFMTMSGGNDWGIFFEATKSLAGPYSFLFIVYVAFALLAVVNVITGIFVEQSTQSGHADKSMMVQEELQAARKKIHNLRDLFREMDEEGQGVLTEEKFQSSLRDERIAAQFRAMKMGVGDAHILFNILDIDHDREICIEEFVLGCSDILGEATSLDAKITQLEVRSLRESLGILSSCIQELTETCGRSKLESRAALGEGSEDLVSL